MNKALLAFATAATLAAATVTAPTKADARCFGCAVGAGVVAGALIGAAIAASSGRYNGGSYAYARTRSTTRVATEKQNASGSTLGPMTTASSGGSGTASLGPTGTDSAWFWRDAGAWNDLCGSAQHHGHRVTFSPAR